jgi:hypothetical protein
MPGPYLPLRPKTREPQGLAAVGAMIALDAR